MIRKAFKEHDEGCIGDIDDRCEEVLTTLFEEAHEHAREKVYIPVFEVIVQTAVKDFFSGAEHGLVHDIIHKRADF